ncbi:PfkB family carbohydrate kinase [Pontibacter sp. CAU 1760]
MDLQQITKYCFTVLQSHTHFILICIKTQIKTSPNAQPLDEVEDTIGSGDAFLATFLTNYLKKKPLAYALERDCLIGAFLATQYGATPDYEPSEITEDSLKTLA